MEHNLDGHTVDKEIAELLQCTNLNKLIEVHSRSESMHPFQYTYIPRCTYTHIYTLTYPHKRIHI